MLLRISRRGSIRGLAVLALVAAAGAVGVPMSVRAATVLSIAQTVSGAAVVGQNLTFNVTMTNTGMDTFLEGIDDNTPVGPDATFISLRSTGIGCGGTHGNAVIVCAPVQLAPGASVSYALTVRPTAAGSLVNTALGDPDFLVFSQVTAQVAPAPTDVQVTGFAGTGSPNRGATFSYTFQVKDNGPWSAGDVTFSEQLPSQVSFVGANADNGSPCAQTAGTVSCDLGGLIVGQQVQVFISVVAPAASSTFTNTATVTPSVTDTQPSNNTIGVTVQVK
jgi:uncharacterized repeat protein (TIGR01451 family)